MAHITLAISEDAIQDTFHLIKRQFRLDLTVPDSSGLLEFRLRGHFRRESGTVELEGEDSSFHIKELDWVWDELSVRIMIDIAPLCFGGGCIRIPPFGRLCIPRWCLFAANPDLVVSFDIGSVVAHELSFHSKVKVRYYDPENPPIMGTICAALGVESAPKGFEWQVLLDPQPPLDLDVFDLPDVVGDRLEEALTTAVEGLIPEEHRNAVLAGVSNITQFVRDLLDIPDDFGEWLENVLKTDLELKDVLENAVIGFFAKCKPIVRIQDPWQVIPATEDPPQLAVELPITNLDVDLDDDELRITMDVG